MKDPSPMFWWRIIHKSLVKDHFPSKNIGEGSDTILKHWWRVSFTKEIRSYTHGDFGWPRIFLKSRISCFEPFRKVVDSNWMVLLAFMLPWQMYQSYLSVRSRIRDVINLTYDVIEVTRYHSWALYTLNIQQRCIKTHHSMQNWTGNTLVKVSCRYDR